jgi:hypothetical protein
VTKLHIRCLLLEPVGELDFILLFVFHFANRGELPQKFFKLLGGISFFFWSATQKSFRINIISNNKIPQMRRLLN